MVKTLELMPSQTAENHHVSVGGGRGRSRRCEHEVEGGEEPVKVGGRSGRINITCAEPAEDA